MVNSPLCEKFRRSQLANYTRLLISIINDEEGDPNIFTLDNTGLFLTLYCY